jgi:hypothetical protein
MNKTRILLGVVVAAWLASLVCLAGTDGVVNGLFYAAIALVLASLVCLVWSYLTWACRPGDARPSRGRKVRALGLGAAFLIVGLIVQLMCLRDQDEMRHIESSLRSFASLRRPHSDYEASMRRYDVKQLGEKIDRLGFWVSRFRKDKAREQVESLLGALR